ncbi:WD repeat-containing protein [Reticulomyxa filosa]|uniref:WD repeat-containing protein n=1 Tax=Reticulomyxa filosa TaxID=46433 RepID=X6LYY6_RETFI|nr:WD repeat-containing protein [Reticulomyxa filosa]|eukprot:ETO06571.1 WD repeat-containing protein [Reticulomyxa filosa]
MQTTDNEPNDAKSEQNTKINTISLFETLPALTTACFFYQCVSYKDELLVCGAYGEKACYSYHIIRKQYKRICTYPDTTRLFGHCVIKRVHSNDSNEITLFSFGGSRYEEKHALVMQYISIWDDEKDERQIEKSKHYNEWSPIMDNHNKPIFLGRKQDDFRGIRALIGGSNNNLLFITYYPKDIDVFDLNTFQYVNHTTLPIDTKISFHCFVLKTENELITPKADIKQSKSKMVLFCEKTGLSIDYDEVNNIFHFRSLWICSTMKHFYHYAFVCINDIILFFGGWNGNVGYNTVVSNAIHKYSIQKDKWMKFELTLPIPSTDCIAVLSEDNMFVHILGGQDDEWKEMATHIQTKVAAWMKEETELEKQWIVEEEEKRVIEETKRELVTMKGKFNVKKLKVEYNKIKKRIEIEMVIEHWNRLLSIKMGWIDNFNIIISQYILVFFFVIIFLLNYIRKTILKQMKYFKLSKKYHVRSGRCRIAKFSLDCTKIVASSDNTIRIWNIELGKEIQVLKGHTGTVNDAQFSPDAKLVVSCSNDTTIRLWDVNSGQEIKIIKGHIGNITSVQFSPDGKFVVSSAHDKTVRLWNVKSGEEIKKLECLTSKVTDVKFSRDGHSIVLSYDNTIGIWDVRSDQTTNKLLGHPNGILRSQFSPDGLLIVSFSVAKIIQIWNAATGKELARLEGHIDMIWDVKFFPDGQTIVSCSNDKTIRLWDVKLGVEVQTLEGHSESVIGLDVSTDGNTIVSCSNDGTIRTWVPL